ncbi:hypothetical protein [Limnobaculum eriocheiris]|nr:hypothetical protein [Limnobaculum eriocheiris]
MVLPSFLSKLNQLNPLLVIEDGTHPLDGDTLEKLNAHWYIATYS